MKTKITKGTLQSLCSNCNSDTVHAIDPYESIVVFEREKEKLYLICSIECYGENQQYRLVHYGKSGWEITDEFLDICDWGSFWSICGLHAGDEYLDPISGKNPLDDLIKYVESRYGRDGCCYYMSDEIMLSKQFAFKHSYGNGKPEVFICYFAPALLKIHGKSYPRRYAIQIREILQDTVIVIAENEQQAITRVEEAIEREELWLSTIDDFVDREIKVSDRWAQGIVGEDDVSFYTQT